MGRPIGQEEIAKAIGDLTTSKSVGGDGISDEAIIQNKVWIIPPIEIIIQNSRITCKLPKQRLKGVVTYIHKKKDTKDIKNYRPITLITIIYKIWEIMANRINPYMELLTTGQQTAYKQGRSTIDILSLIQNSIQNEETRQLILIDLSKACGSIDRNTIWTILYQQGFPLGTDKQL